MNKPTAIIFDFDDTLIDAGTVINKSLESTFKEFSISPELLIERNIDKNHSMRDYFKHIFADRIAEARTAYYKYYDLYAHELAALEKAEEVLNFLKAQKVFTTVVSNKSGEKLRHEITNKFLWKDYFEAIIGSGDAEEDKPSSKPAILALKNADLVNYENVWLIGDSIVDMQTAQNLGCKAILFGGKLSTNHDNLSIHKSVLDHTELLQLLRRIYV